MSTVALPKVDIFIVNFNSGSLLRDCLESILTSPEDASSVARIQVVDNASSDDSVLGIETLSDKVRLIRNETNCGFAAACNLGARQGNSPYLLFLNPDTRLFPGALTVPLRFMISQNAERTGICGIQLVGETGLPHRCCCRIPSARHLFNQALGLSLLAPGLFPGVALVEFDHASDRKVDHVMGAFFLVRRKLFQDLGGLDERFFVYLEDLDFSLRARAAGWETQYLAGARAFHLGGGTSRSVKADRLFYALRSRLVFACKHLHPLGAAAIVLATCLIEPGLRLIRAILRASRDEAVDTISGYVALYRHLPSTLRTAIFEEGRS